MVSVLWLEAAQGEAGIPGTKGHGGTWVWQAQESRLPFSLSWFADTKSSVLEPEGSSICVQTALGLQ